MTSGEWRVGEADEAGASKTSALIHALPRVHLFRLSPARAASRGLDSQTGVWERGHFGGDPFDSAQGRLRPPLQQTARGDCDAKRLATASKFKAAAIAGFAELSDDVFERHLGGGLTIDGGDVVTGLKRCFGSG